MERQEQDNKKIKTIAVLFCYLLFVAFGGLTTPFVPNEGAQVLNIELALEGSETENEVFTLALRYGEIAIATESN